ncbi:MAG: helix-turn-helix transcriptional regulator [Pseudomonadota bacterium]
MGISERLKRERERLDLSQSRLGELIGVGKTTVINWEKGASAPDAVQLAAISTTGADVLYVITGKRSQSMSATAELPPRQRALINNYELCKPDAKRQLDQLAALLAAGLPGKDQGAATQVKQKNSKGISIGVVHGNVTKGDQTNHIQGDMNFGVRTPPGPKPK